jgi:flagellar protein FliL
MADKNDKREEEEVEEGAKPSRGKSSIKLILMIVLGAFLVVGVSVASTIFIVRSFTPPVEAQPSEDGEVEDEADVKKDKKDKKSKKKKGKKSKKEKNDTESTSSEVVYLPLDPPFVVNFANPESARFLQVSMEVMAHGAAVIEDVKKHMPVIRNNLVLLLSRQDYQTLISHEGKEQIRVAALAEIQKIMNDHTGKTGVEAVYFTSFVMQ